LTCEDSRKKRAKRDARGQMKLHSRNEKGSEFDFIYEID
jgi:hypothetical protein